MSSPKTHYETLEVDKNASEEEIKKAYRRLSLQYHPDRNPTPEASDKIREINTAYETLGDAETRKRYDRQLSGRVGLDFFGEGGMDFPPFATPRGGGGGPQMFFHTNFGNGGEHVEFANIGNIFEAMFNGGINPEMFHQHIHQQIHKPMPIVMNIEISLTQCYSGCVYSLDVNKVEVFNGEQIRKTDKIQITIPEGIDNNEMIIVREQGNQVNGVKGDIKVFVAVKKDPQNIAETSFERSEINLVFKKEISLKEALCGFSFNIKHLNGSNYCIKNTSIITPNQKQVIPKLGMKREGNLGSLVVEYTIVFPTSLDDEKKEAIKELL
jgi:DnaJ-class molecular chaperone